MGECIELHPNDRFEARIPFSKVYPGFAYRAVFVEFDLAEDDEDYPEPRAVIQTDLNEEPRLTLNGELAFSGVVPDGVTGYFVLTYVEAVRLSDNSTKKLGGGEFAYSPALNVTPAPVEDGWPSP